MPLERPIPLSTQTQNARYQLIRRGNQIEWFIGYEECLPEYRIERPNGFQFNTLELILRGLGTAEIGKHTFPLTTGTVFVYGPNTRVAFRAREVPMTKYFLSAIPASAWQKSWFHRLHPEHPLVIPGALTGTVLLEQILSARTQTGVDPNAVAESMLEGFGAWIMAAGRSPQRPSEPDLLQRAFQLLEEDFRNIANVAVWANRLCVSTNHLCRLFKQHHHKSPYAELTDRKLQHACRRLSETSLRVQDVALEVGYEDPFHFSRLFKRRMGFPPSQLR